MATSRPMNPAAAHADTPGIDVVMNGTDLELQTDLLSPQFRTLVGALHRRFWNRRHDMLQARAAHLVDESVDVDARPWTIESTDVPTALRPGPDLRGESCLTWDDRLEAFRSVRNADMSDPAVDLIRTRGWDVTEPAVLVDGRAVPGSVFDLAMLMMQRADELRDGHATFLVCPPAVSCPVEAKLWTDLVNLAEDRLGVERGTVQLLASADSTESLAALV